MTYSNLQQKVCMATYVHEHTKENGTKVKTHYRSTPNTSTGEKNQVRTFYSDSDVPQGFLGALFNNLSLGNLIIPNIHFPFSATPRVALSLRQPFSLSLLRLRSLSLRSFHAIRTHSITYSNFSCSTSFGRYSLTEYLSFVSSRKLFISQTISRLLCANPIRADPCIPWFT